MISITVNINISIFNNVGITAAMNIRKKYDVHSSNNSNIIENTYINIDSDWRYNSSIVKIDKK